MKKTILSFGLLALMATPMTSLAQDSDLEDRGDGEEVIYPTIETGYYRFVNNGYGDVLSTDAKYGFSLFNTENSAQTLPATVFYYDTNGMFSFADAISQITDEQGQIDVTTFQTLMATSAWKSGGYSTYDITGQGISYGGYLRNLRKYINAAIASFPTSDEVKDFYENGPSWWLQIAMIQYFKPADMTSLETFQAAVKRFMDTWGMYMETNIYLMPVQNNPNGFLLTFHSPFDIAKMQDTQEQINNMVTDDMPQGYNYDFFGTFKRKVIEEAAKELGAESEGLKYLERVIAPIELNKQYYIGENEKGELYVTGLSQEAIFGENGELTTINQDELIWNVMPVNEDAPLLSAMHKGLKDSNEYFYTTLFTDFAYQLGEGVEAFYIDAVNDGVAHLAPIAEKVPALTAVVLRSKNAAAVGNVLLPLTEEVAPIEGNLLKGTCLPLADAEGKSVMQAVVEGETGNIVMAKATGAIAANTCYIDTPADESNIVIAQLSSDVVAGISTVKAETAASEKVFDMQGRPVSGQLQKGIYIVNGKKVVR